MYTCLCLVKYDILRAKKKIIGPSLMAESVIQISVSSHRRDGLLSVLAVASVISDFILGPSNTRFTSDKINNFELSLTLNNWVLPRNAWFGFYQA